MNIAMYNKHMQLQLLCDDTIVSNYTVTLQVPYDVTVLCYIDAHHIICYVPFRFHAQIWCKIQHISDLISFVSYKL